MISKIKKGVVITATALAMVLPASATTFDSEALNSFVKTATACVVGKVTSVEYVTRSGIVFTKATFAVTDTAFGSTSSEISVLSPGGVLPNTKFPVAQVIAGAPSLRSGQEMMLVLNATPESGNTYAIAGLANGAINVINNGSGPQVALAGGQSVITLADAMEDIQSIRNGANTVEAE